MSNLIESSVWESIVNKIENGEDITEALLNAAPQALTNRTKYLKDLADAINAALNSHAGLTNPHDATAAATANRMALRDGSGDLVARLFRTEWTGGGWNGAYVLGQNGLGAGADNYARPVDMATLRSVLGFSYSFAGNGYAVLPGGLILQWGSVYISVDNTQYSFPIAFPNACRSLVFSGYNVGAQAELMNIGSGTLTRFGWNAYATAAGTYLFFAVGY